VVGHAESHLCEMGQPQSVPEFAADLCRQFADRIQAEVVVPAQAAQLADFPVDLDPRLHVALRSRGIEHLYSHQRECWDHLRGGANVVIATPTASGKSLCYNLPVLHDALSHRRKALYLFPTKALAQDQVAELLEINRAANLRIATYTFDGDTPADARSAVRRHGDIVVSNPDMLHRGILPHHTQWAQFFESLAWVVIDEAHVYRGIFGAHVANVLRRLRRITRFYGVSPQFVLCSATLANAAEFAARLIDAPVLPILRSGAPRGEQRVLLWNPPVVNPDLGIRASSRSQVTKIAKAAVERGLHTIVFANSRLAVEVLTKYLKDRFDRDTRLPARVAAYRGGYLPQTRRGTERMLRAGDIDCVVATSALELGVDIGGLDVCVLNGYPGSIAATWQRLGRAGRRNRSALGVLVASSDPLDQYILNPEFFSFATPEHARLDPDQLLVLMEHVRCAAFELPFERGESFGRESLSDLLAYLEQEGVLHRDGGRWHWMADSYQAANVNLARSRTAISW